jgi:methyl-accepting chemotaxis protein
VRLTIGQKVLLGYGLAMVFMAMMAIAAYRNTGQLLSANDWVRHTFLVIGAAEDIRTNLIELESAERGYVITGDEQYLESVAGSRTRLPAARNLLRTLTTDNVVQQRRMDVMDVAIDRGIADLVAIASARRLKGLPAALASTELSDGRARMAEIRNQLAVMEDEERTLLSDREGAAQADAKRANRIILAATMAGFILAGFIGLATRRSIAESLDEFQQFVTAVGQGDLTHQPVEERHDELGKLARGLNQMATRLRNMTTQTRGVTERLSSATMDILASAREQAALTGQQVAAYQETNATMQEVSKSGLQIAERAEQITVTAAAVSAANTSGLDAVQKANQTVEAIHEQAEAVAQNIVSLSEKTQAVGDILATVNDIAEQSHLLALNAAIEAAAAGEHGRSFAVVAGEIKNLADQSKAATVQVKTILGDIQKEINTSVMLTEEAVKRVDVGKHQADVAASAIRNMAANIDQSVQAFQQIVAGTNQQQIGFENVMQAMKDLARAAEQAAGATRQTEKSAASLTDLGTQLEAATEGYRL